MGWTVEKATDDKRRVTFHYELGEQTLDRTLTGGTETIEEELLATPARPFVAIVLFPSVLLLDENEALQVGDRRSFPVAGREGVLEITGTDTRLGIEGYTSVWEVDGQRRYEDCIALDPEIVLNATYYSAEDTEALLRVELVEYERD